MSGSSKKRVTVSKADILEEVLIPLIKHLEIAEEEVQKKSSGVENINKMFEEIKGMVESKKKILNKRKEWEGEVIDKLSAMERHINSIIEEECNVNNKLEAIHKELEEMVGKVTPPVKPKTSNFETGEPSRSSMAGEGDESFPFIDEIIETLDPQLRHCLYCLSIFPEKYVIKRRLLVYWWIGMKLVRPVVVVDKTTKTKKVAKTAEEVGLHLFDDLVEKGILIPGETRKHNGVVDQCTIEPIMHKKLISSAMRKRFILNVDDNNGLKVCTIRKNKIEVNTILNVEEMYLKSDVISDHDVSKMVLMQVGQWKCGACPHIKADKTMQAGQWRYCVHCNHIEADKTDFLNDVAPNLTYLSLQGISRIPELPEPIGDCTSLMILDIRACHNLEKLPSKIKSWKNLTHLDVSMCYLLDHMPKWISTLRNLEVFKGFVLGSAGNKNRCRLTDISDLRKLRKLSISIGHETNVDPRESDSLKKLDNLRSLTITWGINVRVKNIPQNGQVEPEKNTESPNEEEKMTEPRNEEEQITEPRNEEEQIIEPRNEEEKITEPRNEEEQIVEPRNEEEKITETRNEEEQITESPNEEEQITEPRNEEEQITESPNEEEQITEPRNEEEQIAEPRNEQEQFASKIIHPPANLEKLDLRCFPMAEAPKWLSPMELKKLKRLYIRGGNLTCFGTSNSKEAWVLEVLRLRFLKNFEAKLEDLRGQFPHIRCVEHVKCEKLTGFPPTTDGFWFSEKKYELSPSGTPSLR